MPNILLNDDAAEDAPDLNQSDIPALPDAWLFVCNRPGLQSILASVDPSGAECGPFDKWTSIKRFALFYDEDKYPCEKIWDAKSNIKNPNRDIQEK